MLRVTIICSWLCLPYLKLLCLMNFYASWCWFQRCPMWFQRRRPPAPPLARQLMLKPSRSVSESVTKRSTKVLHEGPVTDGWWSKYAWNPTLRRSLWLQMATGRRHFSLQDIDEHGKMIVENRRCDRCTCGTRVRVIMYGLYKVHRHLQNIKIHQNMWFIKPVTGDPAKVGVYYYKSLQYWMITN